MSIQKELLFYKKIIENHPKVVKEFIQAFKTMWNFNMLHLDFVIQIQILQKWI